MPPALLSLLDRIGGPRRATILIVGLAAAAGVFGIAHWAGAPSWVPAFGDVPIGEVGALTDRLTQAGVEYKLGGNGSTVLVKEDQVATARVALARAGVLPANDRPGFELFDQPSWGQTDLTQRVNLKRALEGQLERTISGMRGIKSARVNLVLPEAESYGSTPAPAEASVVLEADGAGDIRAEVVKGIAITVAASVEGLSSDNVVIVDAAGIPLSFGDDASTATGMSSRQHALEAEYEENQRQKVEQLLTPILGRGNAKVTVNATLSFDRVQRSSQTVDPDRQAVVKETKAEIIPGAEGGAAQTQQAADYMNSSSTETVSSAVGTVKRLSVAVLLASPVAGRDTGNAVVPAAADSAAMRTQVETLVKSAVGYDEARGDVVTVTMLPFAAPRVIPAAAVPTTFEQLQTMQRPALSALGILFAFIIALLTLRAAGKTTESVTQLAAAGVPAGYLPREQAGGAPAFPAPYASAGLPAGQEHAQVGAQARPQPMIHIPHNPMRDQVLATVEQQPDVAAKLMRAWLRDG